MNARARAAYDRASTPPQRRLWRYLTAAAVVLIAAAYYVPPVRPQAFLIAAGLGAAALVVRKMGQQ